MSSHGVGRMCDPLPAAWDRLATVTGLAFTATSTTATGWAGAGTGQVTVGRVGRSVIVFDERGTWVQSPSGRQFTFTNAFRWTLAADSIRLEHLRFGAARPVHLFNLVTDGKNELTASTPHACGDDRYTATLTWDSDAVRLAWRIRGPKTDVTIGYTYRR